jgi:Transposase IS66 family
MSPVLNLDVISNADLKALVLELWGRVAELERTVAAQRDEIARLKGLKGRPTIKPSGLERAGTPKPPGSDRKSRRKRPKASRLIIDEDRIVSADVPAGSRFKGYQDFLIQDLIVRPRVVRWRGERWLTPDGRTLVAPWPAGLAGHFGPDLRRHVLALYHQGQLTVPRLVEHLTMLGLLISKRQVVRLLGDGSGRFRQEAAAVLRAGLATARWSTVDDTGARHQGRNATCTQVGNDHFAWFGTSRSRLNVLELLRAGHTDYVVNAAALAYMRRRALAGPLMARIAEAPATHFSDAAAWQRHLEGLEMPSRPDTLDPVRLATEGAVWGSIQAHGLLPDTVIVSDDAGQFEVGEHALCWVHAERLIHRLDTFTDHQHAAQQRIRMRLWWFYRDLKAYCRAPSRRRRSELRARFDRIFGHRTGFVVLDRLLERLRANKAELLRVLDRPEIPLHTNGSENDIRAQVIRRKIRGGTRSDAGRDCRDAFLGLIKTCQKLGLSFWAYLGDRLATAEAPAIPPCRISSQLAAPQPDRPGFCPCYRRERDSNSRYGCPCAEFRVCCIQPLAVGHPSAGDLNSIDALT